MSFSGRTSEKITNEIVSNDPFYPDIDLGDFQEKFRINSEYRINVLRFQLKSAVIFVNAELIDQMIVWSITNNYGSLDDVPSEFGKVGDESRLITLYKSAVYNRAKAKLLMHYATMNRRDNAENTAKEADSSYDMLMDESNDAIRELQGKHQGSLSVYEL